MLTPEEIYVWQDDRQNWFCTPYLHELATEDGTKVAVYRLHKIGRVVVAPQMVFEDGEQ